MEVLFPSPLLDHPNRPVSGGDGNISSHESHEDKEEKQEIGPVDSLGKEEEEGNETGRVKAPRDGEGEGRSGEQFLDWSGDQSTDRSTRGVELETRIRGSPATESDGEIPEEELTYKQVDSYRAIDRSGPVRGPVWDWSNDRSPLNSSYNEGGSQAIDRSKRMQ